MDKHFQALYESKAALDDSVRADANKWRKLLSTLEELGSDDKASIAIDEEYELALESDGSCFGDVRIEIQEKD